MTEDPRGYTQAGYQQPYDWRYGAAQQPGQQYGQAYGSYPAGPTRVSRSPRKHSRTAALTAGALAISAVSAGIGGAVATMVKPDGHATTTITSAALPGGSPTIPTAV